MVWTFLMLTPLLVWSRQVKNPSKPEINNSIDATLDLIGEPFLCLTNGSVLGTYTAGGEDGDVYEWTLTDIATGNILDYKENGQLETYKYVYTQEGTYNVNLKIRRGSTPNYFEDNLEVKVQQGPELALRPDYLLCADSPVLLTALDPDTTPVEEYTIIWRSFNNEGDTVELGRGNEFLATSAGYHLVELYQTLPNGTESCTVNGATYVGPPVDFQFEKSSEQICEGNSISITTDTPLSGEWFIQKQAAGAKTSLGQGFEINLTTAELSGPGIYEVTFRTASPGFPDCPSERKTTFEYMESPEVNALVLTDPDECGSSNGALQVTAVSELDALMIPEIGISQTSISAGDTFTFPNLQAQVYTLLAVKNGCETTELIQVKAVNPSTPLTPAILREDETCAATGVVEGNVSVDFGAPISNGTYRILSPRSGEIKSGTIPNSGELDIPLSSGQYLLEMIVDGCSYPIETLSIAKQPEVEFTVPETLNICETYVLTPETDQNLRFTLTFPDLSTLEVNAGGSFTLTEEGPYSITAVDRNGASGLCAKKVDFDATFSSSISFEPVLRVEECFDPIKYEAVIEGISPEEASIRWLNDQGEIVGRNAAFYPSKIGFYSLLVQPLRSGFCPVTPVEFEVESPITLVPMGLEASKICPDPGYAWVNLTTDEEEVAHTEWVFYDQNNNRTELTDFDDTFEIEAANPGTYEAITYNSLGCEIGRNYILVEESMLLTPPSLAESYAICSKENTMAPINPGDFAGYQWYFGDQLVSTNNTYKPNQVGDYTLVVTTEDGCELSGSFRTYDACNFSVVYPNAMELGNPNKDFRVLVSEGVTDAELFVMNRQGALIHYERTVEVALETPILNWDGKTSGKEVPTGTYLVVVVLRNPTYGFEEKMTGTLLVLD
ncbi:PKD domain-containing protein [Algoriphagus halophytocola]|uniref:PKD domain-containing protein n=1 Tax=Algoriphagus halophytocola TaxID=2991499 RepID=A0ABY6ML04_9BACT|nr:hypothetical protein [Algoriphagus sp. TR-M5]UZD24452.1 hypothetical protein OM944_08100 [Algoriphagus sp. TR-M5]